jgi:hypothetical protein
MLHWFLRQAGAGHTFLEHPGDLSLHVQSPLALGVGLPLVALAGVGIYGASGGTSRRPPEDSSSH